MSAETIAAQTKEDDDLPKLPTWKYLGKLAGSRPWMILLHLALNIVTFAVGSQVMGLITREFFDALTGDAPATFSPYTLSAFVIATAMGRVAFVFGAISVEVSNRFAMAALLRQAAVSKPQAVLQNEQDQQQRNQQPAQSLPRQPLRLNSARPR